MENFINEILDELLPALSIDANSGLARPIAQGILHDKISNRLEQLVMPMLADFIDKHGLECPNSSNCNNDGILSEHGCNGTEEDCMVTCPIPAQCEFCYCEPKSKFNLKNDLIECLNASKHSA